MQLLKQGGSLSVENQLFLVGCLVETLTRLQQIQRAEQQLLEQLLLHRTELERQLQLKKRRRRFFGRRVP